MTFEEWLSSVWLEDENRQATKRINDNIRDELKKEVVRIIEDRAHNCSCDTCVAIGLKSKDKMVSSLMAVGIQYLLGENFNWAAALYYFKYHKEYES